MLKVSSSKRQIDALSYRNESNRGVIDYGGTPKRNRIEDGSPMSGMNGNGRTESFVPEVSMMSGISTFRVPDVQQQLFTHEQVQQIVNEAVRRKEEELRDEFQKRLDEQNLMFSRYVQDCLSFHSAKSEPPSYIS